jgi:hypothetical protein
MYSKLLNVSWPIEVAAADKDLKHYHMVMMTAEGGI